MAPEIALEDFFRNPEKAAFRVSPDGRFISFLAPWKSRLNIFVQEIGSAEEPRRITADTVRDIRSYFWKDDRILYLQDIGGDENFQLFSCNIRGEDVLPLTPFPKVLTIIIDDLEEDPDHMIIGLNKRNPEVFDPYRINVRTGRMELLYENPGDITEWVTDHEGKLRLAVRTDGVNSTILYRKDEKSPFQEVITISFKETLAPQFFTFDNKNLYALSNIGRDKTALVVFDLENSKEIERLYENDNYDLNGAYYSKKYKKLLGTSYTGWQKTEWYFFDKEFEEMFQKVQRQLPEYEISFVSTNREEDKYIVAAGSDRNPGKYYLFDKNSGRLEFLAESRPWLKEEHLAPMKPIKYTARDGLTIEGYLTIPVGSDGKNLPTVVIPHGGPWARDVWGYDAEVQFLANRGYAVFQMNFRGSVGFGRRFWELSFKQWGRSMQDDITDGVYYLIREGIADSSRVAIYGGSYGGYATLAGLTFTPELYACGIDYVGVSNLFTFMKTIPPYWRPYLEMMYEMVGHPEKDSALLAAASPVLHADKIIKPLFIAQGANDPRVNKAESDQMVEALRRRGVEVEYMVKDNEGHGFSNEENRFDFYRAMERFLKQHLGDPRKSA
ncbi:MAG: S9 family peptidase [Flavobacteriales bacterium]|nr:S9 family peptidase [Flavobacteriales bacterium]MDW8410809.1 S9 family peptidase [Flavobacteriales bacterium]